MDNSSLTGTTLVTAMAAVGVPTAAITYFATGDLRMALYVLAAVLVALLCYWLVLKWLRQREENRVTGEVSESGTSKKDNDEPEKIKQIRKKFQEGLDLLRRKNEKITDKAWYLVIGEPGSGKTMAIRYCGARFARGMSNSVKGSGGTKNMDWWFMQKSVLIDTAGAMVFSEEGAAASARSDWPEFLEMLRRCRSTRPINGLVLAIPCDKLLSDDDRTVTEKAAAAANQIAMIQEKLGVRFPVYIIITKTDRVTGFREFSKRVGEFSSDQMLGWSNPTNSAKKFDEPVETATVEAGLNAVVDRIRRLRLDMMGGPIPAESRENLYVLPSELKKCFSRVTTYVDAMFGEGGLPLFLRGIYLTYAESKGDAIDLELARQTGIDVKEMLAAQKEEAPDPHFLKDVFQEKIFRETGLVTDSTNASKTMWVRRAIIGGSLALGLILCVWALVSSRQFKQRIASQVAVWTAASEGWDTDTTGAGVWHPIVTPVDTKPGAVSYRFAFGSSVNVGDTAPVALPEYHRQLRTLAAAGIQVPLLFSFMPSGDFAKLKQAQRIVYEASVVRPLVLAARQKFSQNPNQWPPGADGAFLLLVRLESMIYARAGGARPQSPEEYSGDRFLRPMFDFTCGDKIISANPEPYADIKGVFDWVYQKDGGGWGKWPPLSLTAGASLMSNPYVSAALTGFLTNASKQQNQQHQDFILFTAALRDLTEMVRAEDNLLKASPASRAALVEAYKIQKAKVDLSLAALTQKGFLPQRPLSLADAYEQSVTKTQERNAAVINRLKDEMTHLDAIPANASGTFTLPAGIKKELESRTKDDADTAKKAHESVLTELRTLDVRFIKGPGDETPYVQRAAVYESTARLGAEAPGASQPVIGGFTRLIDDMNNDLAVAKKRAEEYQGPLGAEVGLFVGVMITNAKQVRIPMIYERYLESVHSQLDQLVGFPLVLGAERPMSLDELDRLKIVLKTISDEIPVLQAGTDSRVLRAKIDDLAARVRDLNTVAALLLNLDGRVGTVKIVILGAAKQDSSTEFGRPWPKIKINGVEARTREQLDTPVTTIPLNSPAFKIEFFDSMNATKAVRDPLQVIGEWIPLRMLSKNGAQTSDGMNWDLTLRQEERTTTATNTYTLRLRFVFERGLPMLDKWPTASRPVR